MSSTPALKVIPHPERTEIANFIRQVIARELGHEPSAIDDSKPLSRYGLDSITAVMLTGELEEWLKRPVSSDLLVEYKTIDALSGFLQGSAPVSDVSQTEPEPEAAPWIQEPLSFKQKFVRNVTQSIWGALLRVKIEGLERIPSTGPFIVSSNHLHKLDVVVLLQVIRGPVVFVVSEHMTDAPVVSWYLRSLGKTIWVFRGEADRDALARSVAALTAGEVLAVAPEGRISRTGSLCKGQTGVAYVAMRAQVPLLPFVAWGQESIPEQLKRFRRPEVTIKVGTPIDPPKAGSRLQDLEAYTEDLMRGMARMLPESYRGVYARSV
jgi:1-acyl-sn-glycerol-3-phosphate acyltransferase